VPRIRPAAASLGPTILVAEDDPAVRALVEHILSAAGYTVIAAVDGQEALETAASLPSIDLLLTDVIMPRLNGPDLADRLRERWPDQPILFMSGFTADVLGERRVHSPEIGLLLKPFKPAELVERVAAALAGRIDSAGRGPAVA
jgi:two-component system cell cycle sensor histidine kinase/response regulator CckA